MRLENNTISTRQPEPTKNSDQGIPYEEGKILSKNYLPVVYSKPAVQDVSCIVPRDNLHQIFVECKIVVQIQSKGGNL